MFMGCSIKKLDNPSKSQPDKDQGNEFRASGMAAVVMITWCNQR
jgi:hypothetical protein